MAGCLYETFLETFNQLGRNSVWDFLLAYTPFFRSEPEPVPSTDQKPPAETRRWSPQTGAALLYKVQVTLPLDKG